MLEFSPEVRRSIEGEGRHCFPGILGSRSPACLRSSACAATAQPLEVQFVRAWQPPARTLDLSELSGFALAPDGTVFAMDRDRGALWRIAGNEATSTELVGKERPFEAKKVGGVAWMGDGRLAVGNTRNDLLAVIDAQGTAERVFGGGGGGHGELDDPEGLAFSVHRRLYVADQGNNRVAVYSETGVFLHAIGAGPRAGHGAGQAVPGRARRRRARLRAGADRQRPHLDLRPHGRVAEAARTRNAAWRAERTLARDRRRPERAPVRRRRRQRQCRARSTGKAARCAGASAARAAGAGSSPTCARWRSPVAS